MTARRPALAALAAAVLTALLAAGCSTLPTSGPVHTRADGDVADGGEAPYFAPPGPTLGDTPEGIVRGFLLAMQANPPSTAVARSFLSPRARSSWKPVLGTIVYDASSVEASGDVVRAQLSDAHRLDSRGGWDTASSASTEQLAFRLVQDQGQWRIDNPPNAIAVPASYFPSLFVPFNLYFYDHTGTVLVPTRVYLPRGEQTASNLVRGLLRGPSPAQSRLLRTAFQPGTELDLGVVAGDNGVADVPLGPGVLRLTPAGLERAVAQLAWTLRQVPGITRFRVTVDGAPVPLDDGETEVSVRDGSAYDPLAASARDLVGIVDGRVVRIGDAGPADLGGPLGRPGFALRSVALDASGHRVAAVSANGRRLYVAPDRGPRAASAVVPRVDGATDLLRPVYDRFGRLWTVDRTAAGAVVHVVAGGTDRVVAVPGVTGRRVAAFTLTRDGAHLAAAVAGGETPRIVVVDLAREPDGRLLRAVNPRVVDVGDADLGAPVDIAQNGATTVAVLTQAPGRAARITSVELDGSPGETVTGTPDLGLTDVRELVAGPDPALSLAVVTADRRLVRLTGAGEWVRSAVTGVRTAAYPG